MKVLVVPDVHERLDRLKAALSRERLSRVQRIVFLGDWFDTFDQFSEERLLWLCHFIMGAIHLGGVTEDLEDGGSRVIPCDWLLGNHDCHYFFDHSGFMCSGYNVRRKNYVKHMMAPENIAQFKVFTRIGPYVVSHAGFAELTLPWANERTCAEAIQLAKEGQFHGIFAPGRARGGYQEVGGPTWLDWNHEFKHIDDFPQIVGHTMDSKHFAIRTKCLVHKPNDVCWGHSPANQKCNCTTLKSWCLDTGLRHVAIVDDETGAVAIENVA